MSTAASSHPFVDPREAAHVCGACLSPLLQCTGRERLTARNWSMALRCPECGWAGIGDFTTADVEAFDAEAERGRAALHAEAGALADAYVDGLVAAFRATLDEGLVVSESS